MDDNDCDVSSDLGEKKNLVPGEQESRRGRKDHESRMKVGSLIFDMILIEL